MWYLIAVVWIAIMVAIVSTYTRKQRRRTTERAQQLEKMLGEFKADAKLAADALEAPVAPAAVVPQFSRKPRLLPQSSALLYYVFRAGLPDHEIFAGVALDDLLEVGANAPPGQRELVLRRLSQQRLDLVVCTKQLEIVAAVVISKAATAPAAADSGQFVNEWLQAAGIRVVKIDSAAPPRHHQVHALVYG